MSTTDTIFEPFDAADYLDSPEMIAGYLNAAFAESDLPYLLHAMGTVARAHGMTSVAERTGLSRESLYKSLSRDGNPEVSTLLSVLKALDFRLSVSPIERAAVDPADGPKTPATIDTNLVKVKPAGAVKAASAMPRSRRKTAA